VNLEHKDTCGNCKFCYESPEHPDVRVCNAGPPSIVQGRSQFPHTHEHWYCGAHNLYELGTARRFEKKLETGADVDLPLTTGQVGQ
jgi:hypothetical protein